jgi:photosystem II stability/assembly factor-like uncharacterized protein
VQPDGVGTAFVLYSCHALTNWSRDYGETTYLKCKSPDEYGVKVIKETIPGDPDQPTFTVNAFTSQEEDFLLAIDCTMDFQVFYGACSSPADQSGYTKIRHFYRASKTSESEDDIDFIGDEEYAGITLSVEFSAEDVVEILQVVVSQANSGVTEIQGFNDIAMLKTARCEGDCGAEIKACYWGVAVADASYGVATANVWYTNDGGASWNLCAVDPFSENSANCSSCVILPGTTTPRIIVFRGNVSGSYGARASISDDWGASWSEVNMGGNTNGSYINAAFAYSAGMIMTVGNGGYIYYSEDRGTNWTEQTDTTTGVTVELWDIHTADGTNVFACGDNNTVIVSGDGLDSWADATGPADATENLYTIQAPTQYRVICGGQVDGNGECLWISTDGGTVWTNNAFTGSTTVSTAVRRVRIATLAPEQHYVMIHGTETVSTRYGAGSSFYFFRTLDGGAIWTRENLIANNALNGLSVCTINKAWAAGETVGGIAEIQKMYP